MSSSTPLQKNFDYVGNEANFKRDKFETVADMKWYSLNRPMDDGHIVYCAETDTHYQFKSSNYVDVTLGKFRPSNIGEGSEASEEDVLAVATTPPEHDATSDSKNWISLRRLAAFINRVWLKIRGYLSLSERYIQECFLEVDEGIESFNTLYIRCLNASPGSTIATDRSKASFTDAQQATLDGFTDITINYGSVNPDLPPDTDEPVIPIIPPSPGPSPADIQSITDEEIDALFT